MSKTTRDQNDERIFEALRVATTDHWNWDGQTAGRLAGDWIEGFTVSQVGSALRRLETAGRVRGMVRRCSSDAGKNPTKFNAKFWTTIKVKS